MHTANSNESNDNGCCLGIAIAGAGGVLIAMYLPKLGGWAFVISSVVGTFVMSALLKLEVQKREHLRERRKIVVQEQDRIREEWEKSPDGIAYLAECEREATAMQLERERLNREARRANLLPKAQEIWRRFHVCKWADLAEMRWDDFERFVAILFTHMGFEDVSLTGRSDQGADVLCVGTNRKRVAIQVKRWKNKVGNSGIQELLGALVFYRCSEGYIVSPSGFTASAKALSDRDARIILCDSSWLRRQIEKHLPGEVPPFDWEIYEKYESLGKFTALDPPPKARSSQYNRYRRSRRHRRN